MIPLGYNINPAHPQKLGWLKNRVLQFIPITNKSDLTQGITESTVTPSQHFLTKLVSQV